MLAYLACEDPAFDLADRCAPGKSLSDVDAAEYLGDPNVLHWIDERDGRVVGFLLCHVIRLRSNDARELLLYEIGVHVDYRRRGIGRALVDHCVAWMGTNGFRAIWLFADNAGAEAFYSACGFYRAEPQHPMYVREIA